MPYIGNMELRVSQILDRLGKTAYWLSEASGGRISMSAAYRLAADEWEQLPRETLAALCDTLGVEPGEILDHQPKPAGKRQNGSGAA